MMIPCSRYEHKEPVRTPHTVVTMVACDFTLTSETVSYRVLGHLDGPDAPKHISMLQTLNSILEASISTHTYLQVLHLLMATPV